MNPRRGAPVEPYEVTCWNCLGDFDAMGAVWCSDDPKNPTKLCPFCFRCFCAASDTYKQEFWSHAPARLKEELDTLARSRDRLGDILIRMKKITTSQLLDALEEQKATGHRLGEVLVESGMVTREDVAAALKTQGTNPLMDTLGIAYAATPVWEQGEPDTILQYVLTLAARKGASDVRIEPKEDAVNVRYRIDDFFFRVDPIPKHFQDAVTHKLLDFFGASPEDARRPLTRRATTTLDGVDYELIAQTLPTPHGISATIKLVNRATFLKDLPSLGMELEDRVRLLGQLQASSGLVLVSSPLFNGAHTTTYSLMSFLVRGGRDVLSLESPRQFPIEGARQVEVASVEQMQETLRDMVAVRPEALVLFSMPDAATASIAIQLATSVLVIGVVTAQRASQALVNLLQLGLPRSRLAGSLAAVTSQRLARQICRICRETAQPPGAQTLALHGIGPEQAQALRFFRGRGCPSCNKVGYRGRRAMFEVMTTSPELKDAIEGELDAEELEGVAMGTGMRTLRETCLSLVTDGTTTFDEFVRLKL
ncbi:MAG TPA: ATPase, T2SS/T4P/T4SS family [Vicinamibacteria bacterium]|nr:ATPase, T2SS/T4P/T4SS family [Vicinamibacteria bacterium]